MALYLPPSPPRAALVLALKRAIVHSGQDNISDLEVTRQPYGHATIVRRKDADF